MNLNIRDTNLKQQLFKQIQDKKLKTQITFYDGKVKHTYQLHQRPKIKYGKRTLIGKINAVNDDGLVEIDAQSNATNYFFGNKKDGIYICR